MYKTIWNDTLELIRKTNQFDANTFRFFETDTYIYNIENNTATIIAPQILTQQILLKNHPLITEQLSIVLQKPMETHILLQNEVTPITKEHPTNRLLQSLFNFKIEEKYTFDNFIVGKNNREANFAALSACNYPGELNNPIFIYGNSGLGKTHLLHAILNFYRVEKPEKKILYIYSEDFVTLLINAMQNKTVEEVKEAIHSCDILLIDDIQRLKQSSSQEIFFNMYNKLIADKKQIVITSDIHPTELKGIENRLISRFSSGLSVSVGSPEFETARAILQKKLEGRNDNVIIESDALDFLATRFSSDVRKLEGALNELIFKAVLYNPETISIDFTQEVFKEHPVAAKSQELTLAQIIQVTADFYGLSPKQIESKSRTKNIANARHIVVYLCRKHLSMPFAKIGLELGGRDHTTIMNSYDKMTKFIKEKEMFSQAVIQLEQKLGIK
ncbi:MAG: chromosomal replication initiator protein DnaA [Longicatena sp.]|nr:chromosomal replication initiator protein DnaA [Longicatena sp.]